MACNTYFNILKEILQKNNGVTHINIQLILNILRQYIYIHVSYGAMHAQANDFIKQSKQFLFLFIFKQQIHFMIVVFCEYIILLFKKGK